MNDPMHCSTVAINSWRAATPLPFVSIVMPVYNEEAFIQRCLQAVLEQDYPADRLEIIIVDGMSKDRTREIVTEFQAGHPNIHLVENPKRIVPTGLNRAIACARGEVIVRLDGHCEYPKDYVRKVVELRQQTGADNLGGVLVPMGRGYVQQAVALAYLSPVGLGGATALAGAARKTSGHEDTIREVDTVHGGCWRKDRLIEIGGFDEAMVRNQDDELSFRLRKNNGKIYQCLSLRVVYHVRNSFKKLFLQFVQYGYWKVQVIRRHPKQASLRHIAPGAFVATLAILTVLGALSSIALIGLLGLMSVYLTTILAASLVQVGKQMKLLPGVLAAIICMHIGYGLGFLLGCQRNCFQRSPSGAALFAEPTR